MSRSTARAGPWARPSERALNAHSSGVWPTRAGARSSSSSPNPLASEHKRKHALRGDEAELFRRHADWLVRVTRHRLRCSEALAEDACAHAWLQLCRTQPERTQNLPGWLRVVALHEGLRLLRLAGREPLADDVGRQEQEIEGGGRSAGILANRAPMDRTIQAEGCSPCRF
jgi:Sigma-70 region 2